MADTFDRDKAIWFKKISLDRRVGDRAMRLAYMIGDHLNRGSRTAWPSQGRLADLLGTSVRTVRNLTNELVDAGYLRVETGRGRGHSSRYAIITQKRLDASPICEEKADGGFLFTFEESGNPGHKKRKTEVVKRGSPLPTNLSEKNPSEEPTQRVRSRSSKRKYLPETWPDPEQRARAIKHWQDVRRDDLVQKVGEIAQNARSYFKRARPFSFDWSEEWMNWARNEVKHDSAKRQTNGGIPAAEAILNANLDGER